MCQDDISLQKKCRTNNARNPAEKSLILVPRTFFDFPCREMSLALVFGDLFGYWPICWGMSEGTTFAVFWILSSLQNEAGFVRILRRDDFLLFS
jgi:hypothetical protein